MRIKHVLDLDLDFFLKPYNNISASPNRLSDKDFKPWTENEVRDFLENSCLLDKDNPILGKFIIEHIDAFYCLRDLISNEQADCPFEMVHIDTHADLGCGDSFFKYFAGKYLHLPIEQRSNPIAGNGGMNSGNYLAFILACRWVNKLDFVLNPLENSDLFDQFPSWIFENDELFNPLQLKACNMESISAFDMFAGIKPPVVQLEPAIPCDFYTGSRYKSNSEFDFLILAQSPGFTPSTSDKLIPIIQEYFIDAG